MKARRESILAGIQPVAAALKANAGAIRRIRVAEESGNQRVRDLALMAGDAGIEVVVERRDRLDQLAGIERHQDIIAEVRDEVLGEADLEPLLEAVQGDPLLLVLDGLQDPHNLGACLRTAEAAGAHAVIITRDRSAGLTTAARKTSAGASELLPVLQVTNLARVLRTLKQRGIWLVGTSEDAERELYEQDLSGPLALVLGSEGRGMRRLTSESCDFLVRIPMAGAIESLNVSVAAGVCLYEALRQRRPGRAATAVAR
ncbi:MAG: 23S rRNA (guanosine(2251)-2'-O)-methyltransferase RlmB [Xanthomonadales bacterium]|nr:23S rRNA (guanosine(2251)-2'-O)-methyltransferase RlmB [Xanthomonadales bacterium]NIN60781.1 23S rRNA (guanosine(2251)-2'-O)-methyltransferase RlmB [Xanthomonadales bacterium]NIN76143.1 23S rRNA (guanosine(2251)-2'-O)-methyltransferase RlmB [Xanthomonadales bacterium]NIO15364.1 23S rRNA (guanosine(2251)-2'-O)-methyltransferase RlmB [Xanthomonadales bacterium]NIP13174.1 23S rRNA (guanosine(2251)-2'-O)-methyltransferase RlmB [Xanthomonadales bacterium]